MNENLIKEIVTSFSLDPIVAELLVKRGFDSVDAVRSYLYPSKEDFSDPFALSGMTAAAERIRRAIDEGEKIVVYGDYDCDGITATSILYGYLASIGADVAYFIPSRFDTGYGLSTESLEYIAETYYPDLIVTVDCGISSVEEAEYLQDVLAIDLVITDHHNLPNTLPNTIVVDPKLDPTSPCTDLCAAGVAFKLVQALGGLDAAWKYIELAAIGTVADVVPLTAENRVIVSLGLAKINSREVINKGLRLLIQSIDYKKPIDAHAIGFQIGPRINSPGRIGGAEEAVRLFIADEYVELQGIVEKMEHANELRRSLVEQTLREAHELLKEYDLTSHRVILLYKSDWSTGIVGLACGRLRSEFNRPVILLCGEDELTGSARSIDGIDISETIKAAAQYLVRFGGHKSAAGLTVLREHLIEARNAMDAYLEATYSDEIYARSRAYDMEIAPEDVTISLAESISRLEPFGTGNPCPLFKFTSDNVTLLLNGENVKGRLNDRAEIIGFKRRYLAEGLSLGLKYTYLCECSLNEFRNVAKAQMRITSDFVTGRNGWGDPLFAFNRYVRSLLYRDERGADSVIRVEELDKSLYDDRFCTAYISFSPKSIDLAQSILPLGRDAIEYGTLYDAPWNEILVAPENAPLGYKRIVLLDTPLTKGYVARLAKMTDAEIVVVRENFPYQDVFRSIDLSNEALYNAYKRIERLIFAGGGASTPVDLARKLSEGSEKEFLIYLYILYNAECISIGNGCEITMRKYVYPTESVLFNRILSLKRIL